MRDKASEMLKILVSLACLIYILVVHCRFRAQPDAPEPEVSNVQIVLANQKDLDSDDPEVSRSPHLEHEIRKLTPFCNVSG